MTVYILEEQSSSYHSTTGHTGLWDVCCFLLCCSFRLVGSLPRALALLPRGFEEKVCLKSLTLLCEGMEWPDEGDSPGRPET